MPAFIDGKAHFVKFEPNEKQVLDFKQIRTAENIKHFIFPSRDVVARFPEDITRREPYAQYLVGVKACDVRGLEIYDRVFEKWEPCDPIYKERRKSTVIISADCPLPEPSCFCSLMNVNPYCDRGCLSDINLTPLASGLLFDVFSEKGESVIKLANELLVDAREADVQEQTKVRMNARNKLAEINDGDLKKNLAILVEKATIKTIRASRNECVECFACLHVCPTCYCFMLSDYKTGNNIERVRTWDACYYAAYARVGGGANPRSRFDERFWNRFACKFNYFHQYEEMFACSGCGRCYVGCSAKIDIREILKNL